MFPRSWVVWGISPENVYQLPFDGQEMFAAIIAVAMVTLIILLVQFRDQCLNSGFEALQSMSGVKKSPCPQKKEVIKSGRD